MFTRVALEGIDGSGKTTVAEEMVRQYAKEGRSAAIFAPYRAASERDGSDIYDLWQTPEGAAKAIDLLHEVMLEREKQAMEDGTEVLIYDRQWMTAFTEIADKPALVAAWEYFVPAALLMAAPMVAARRLGNDHEASWSTLTAQHDYARKYGAIALGELKQGHTDRVLGLYRSDEGVTVEQIARNIIWDMQIRR